LNRFAPLNRFKTDEIFHSAQAHAANAKYVHMHTLQLVPQKKGVSLQPRNCEDRVADNEELLKDLPVDPVSSRGHVCQQNIQDPLGLAVNILHHPTWHGCCSSMSTSI
jgi:hypothetical protein